MIYTLVLLVIFATDKVQSAQCSGNTEPCRSNYNYDYFNGTTDSSDLETCTCKNKVCHTGWRRPNYVIRVRMFSDVSTLIGRFMFCERFNLPTCSPNGTALVMKGFLFPTTVQSITCRCPDQSPLFYSSREQRPDYVYYFSYICDSHKTMCTGDNSICSSTQNGLTTYPCECPSGFACRIASDGVGRCTINS